MGVPQVMAALMENPSINGTELGVPPLMETPISTWRRGWVELSTAQGPRDGCLSTDGEKDVWCINRAFGLKLHSYPFCPELCRNVLYITNGTQSLRIFDLSEGQSVAETFHIFSNLRHHSTSHFWGSLNWGHHDRQNPKSNKWAWGPLHECGGPQLRW